MHHQSLGAAFLALLLGAGLPTIAPAEEASQSELLNVLNDDSATDNDRATACQKLAIVGTADAVPVLVGLLGNEQFSHYARYALQNIADEKAAAALRAALGAAEDDLLVGVINSVAARRDAASAPRLVELARSANPRVASTAVAALVAVEPSRAALLLEQVDAATQIRWADAVLACAETIAGQGQAAAAMRLVRSLDSPTAPQAVRASAIVTRIGIAEPAEAETLARELLASEEEWRFSVGLQAAVQGGVPGGDALLVSAIDRALPFRHARLLAGLRSIGGPAALAAARVAAESGDGLVQTEAIKTLGALGDAADAKVLMPLAQREGPTGETARMALAEIDDASVNPMIVTMLQDGRGDAMAFAANLIGQRRITEGAGDVVAAIEVADQPEVRVALLTAARRLAVGDTLPSLVDLMLTAESAKERKLATEAALAAASRVTDREAMAASVAANAAAARGSRLGGLLDVLAVLGGETALKAVGSASESDDRDSQNEATRVLGNWPNADAAPLLLRLAGSEHPYAVRCLRGYLRIARQFARDPEQRVAMVEKALAAASRREERVLALQVLERAPTVQALQLATGELPDSRLGTDASASVIKIAEQVADSNPAAAALAARQVINTGGNADTLALAKRLAAQQSSNPE
ncbi:MAG: hypothetical protein AAGJ46_02240 [Planctomycetota bacterium]